MIEIIPSFSVVNGKCAKIGTGSTGNATLYEKPPLELAMFFEENGFKTIDLVDVDGARAENPINHQTLQLIRGYTDLNIIFSGGIRSDGSVTMALEYGANKVLCATLPALDREGFMSMMITFGRDKLIVGADVIDGNLAVKGWLKKADIDAFEHIEYFYSRGIDTFKVSDVKRNGVLEGPNFELMQAIRDKFPDMKLLVSGGVRNTDDIKRLDDMGVNGVIIARGFYENKLKIEDLAPYLN